MQWVGIIFLIWYVFRTKPVTNNYYYKELSEADKIECELIVLRTLKQYNDAVIGELYPELVYEALRYQFDTGQITKTEYEIQLKNITDKIII